MHASFRLCARSSSKVILGSLLMCVPLLLAQNTTAPVDAKKDLPDAPMPVTSTSPSQNNLSFRQGALPPSFDTNRTQSESLRGMSAATERPPFHMNAPTSEKSRFIGKDMKGAGRSPANLFALDPISGHANHTATHSSTQWYTSHIPWAGPIVRRGLQISKAHPHLTTVIKTLKPRL